MVKSKKEKTIKHDEVHPDDDDEEGRSSSPELESLNCCQLKIHRKKIIRERQKHHMDPTYNGPLHKRSCTDVICLFLFVAFLAAWIALGVYAFKSGSPDEIFAPRDSSHKICGYDDTVTDNPFLVFFDLTKCLLPFKCNTPQECTNTVNRLPTTAGICLTPKVCVEKCPEENFFYDYYQEIGQQGSVTVDFVAQKMICVAGVDAKNKDWKGMQALVDSNKCARWYLSSTPIAKRCLPDLSSISDPVGSISIPMDDGTGQMITNTINGVTGNALAEGSVIANALSRAGEFWTDAAQDLMETWPYIVLCLAVGTVLSFVYILLMRWIAGVMVWFSLFACIGLFGFTTYLSWQKYDELRNDNSTTTTTTTQYMVRGGKVEPPSGGEIIKDLAQDQLDAILRNKDTWLVFLIISAAILVILLLMILFLRKRIVLAVALINEASRAVSHAWTTLILPIFPWIIQTGVIAYGITIFAYLLTAGISIYRVVGLDGSDCFCSNGYKENDTCTKEAFAENCKMTSGLECSTATCMFAEKESESFTVYLHLYNLFMSFWALFFVSAVGQLMLASTFATYYWTFKKSDIPLFTVATSACRVLRYHLGTAAFGSLLLAFVAWLRALLEIADSYLKKYDNAFVKAVKCCLRCFFWCLEKFLKFLNKNAYIMCAIHGSNFCVSAKNAFSLLLRNILRVAVLDKVTDFLLFISKLVILAAVGVGSFYLLSEPLVQLQDTNRSYQATYPFVPMIFVIVGTYCIASVFFNVYSMAVDTLFLCFLEDSENNDGSPEKPYFMSKNLMSILGKKNK